MSARKRDCVSAERCGLKPCLSSWTSFGLAVLALKGLARSELGIHPVAAGEEGGTGGDDHNWLDSSFGILPRRSSQY